MARRPQQRRQPWLAPEDRRLEEVMVQRRDRGLEMTIGVPWNDVARDTRLNRDGKSCRLRWMNYLRPGINRGPWTQAEEDKLVELKKNYGNRWSKIAGELPGRTEVGIKNKWNCLRNRNAKLKNRVVSETEVHAHEHLEQHYSHQDVGPSSTTSHGYGVYYTSNEELMLLLTTTTSHPPYQAVLQSTVDDHDHQIRSSTTQLPPALAPVHTNIGADHMCQIEDLLMVDCENTTSGVGDDGVEEIMRSFAQALSAESGFHVQ